MSGKRDDATDLLRCRGNTARSDIGLPLAPPGPDPQGEVRMSFWKLGPVLLLSVGLLGVDSAHSRSTRQMCIAEQVATSDVVFAGKVTALVEPTPKMPGVNRYAVIEVQDVLKGTVPSTVNFVVSGYSAELNPDCCEVGTTHLFFSSHGYEVFEEAEGSFVIATLGKDEFLSATNGRYSTFLVNADDTVVGWTGGSTCSEHASTLKSDVYACIRQLESSPPRKTDE